MPEIPSSADVAIIGGGFFGLYQAEFLVRRAGRDCDTRLKYHPEIRDQLEL